MDRLIAMALSRERSGDSSDKSLQAVLRGVSHWFDKGYKNDNWWYTKIGMPRRLLALAFILDDALTPSLRDSLKSALAVIDANDHPARPGGDRIQVLSNHAKVLLWQRDTTGAAALFRLIEQEARIAPIEEVMRDAGGGLEVRNGYLPAGRGVQADMTFHHRGDRVNSTVTYGMELPEFYTYWALLLRDTPWQFSPTHTRFVIDYYLDAVARHLVGGRYIEPSALNRELSRPDEGVLDSRQVNRLLLIADGYRTSELQQLADELEGKTIRQKAFAHYFWQSAYFVFERPDFHSAVRLHSWRNANQEASHNREGLRNHFRGDGACMLSATGREYWRLWPVFDFRLIPGTTTPLIPYEPLDSWGPVQLRQSDILFAGAVCDSLYGAVGFDFRSGRSDLAARKSWFFFDQGYICLGSDIHSTSPDTIVTTIEQCRLQTAVRREAGGWFFHGGHAYHVLSDGASCSAEHRQGSWRNCTDDVAYADDTVSDSVFSLSVCHGPHPNGASYAYAVCPGADTKVAPWCHILQNSNGIQAVESNDGRLAYVVFYRPGSIVTSRGRIEVDESCMVMVHDDNVWVSDPSCQHYRLRLTTPSGSREIPLPTNMMTGSSIFAGKL